MSAMEASAATDIKTFIGRAIERCGPSTVGIRSRQSAGSGVIVAEGVVLTNAHNVRDAHMEVVFHDGATEDGSVIAGDPDADIALLRAATGERPPITWRPADADVSLGVPVIALANPAGHGLRATFGTISALDQTFRGPRGRRITGSLEHTAPLQRGSSGGPVVDTDGVFLGLNTSRLGEGFYLALPADDHLRAMVDGLTTGEAPDRVQLGVAIAPAHVARRLRAAVGLPDRPGLLVHKVGDDTPAAAAGLARGDLLVRADGRDLERVDDLHALLDGLTAGSTITLDVVRGVEELTVTVEFPS